MASTYHTVPNNILICGVKTIPDRQTRPSCHTQLDLMRPCQSEWRSDYTKTRSGQASRVCSRVVFCWSSPVWRSDFTQRM